MRKAVMIVTGAWALLMSVPALDSVIDGNYHRQRLAGTLSLIAVVATVIAVFLLAFPRAVARLKDKVLVAQLKAQRDALLTASSPTGTTRSTSSGVFASGTLPAAAVGVAVNGVVVVLAFLLVGLPYRLDEYFLVCLLAGGVPAMALALLWRTHEVTRLQREVK